MRWLLSRLRNAATAAIAIGLKYVAVAIALCRWRADYIVERQSGERSLAGAKRVAIFVHYDRRGRVHDYVLHYLNSLRAVGFELVFVSNAPLLSAESYAKLRPLCALILRRKNIGYDFAAYKDSIAALGNVAELDELLLVNDSVYGPFGDLAPILSRCDPRRAVVWGMTDCWFRRFHLQSYFLLFKQPALASEAFARFWNKVLYVQSKGWIIEKYEIGLTQAMTRSNLRCAAIYPYRRVAEVLGAAVASLQEPPEDEAEDEKPRNVVLKEHQKFAVSMADAIERGSPLNSTHHLWDVLLTEFGCPFLKRELLELNPLGIPSLQRWESLLRGAFDYDTDLILRHLEVQARNRAV